MSPSNEERNDAETAFERLCKQPETAAPLLCGGMTQSQDMTVRGLTAVMFRKRVNEEFYNQLSAPTQNALKSALVAAVENEQGLSCRGFLCRILRPACRRPAS